jgi:ABC-type transport system involved in multi-copper enzyme maturation permease subunit
MKTNLFVIILFLISIPGAAAYLEISETQTIIGNGTFEKDFSVQSSPTFEGQKLSEAIVPTYPFQVNATSYYHSDFELTLINNSTIFYEAIIMSLVFALASISSAHKIKPSPLNHRPFFPKPS